MKKTLLIIALIVAGILISCNTSNPALECRRSVTYTVRQGDTLWGIAEKHADLNTYCKVYMPVFQESIKDANPEKFANNRYLQPGDKLTIYYFVKK